MSISPGMCQSSLGTIMWATLCEAHVWQGKTPPPCSTKVKPCQETKTTLLAPQRQADKVQRSRLIPGSVDKVLVQNNPHLISKTSIKL